MVKAYETITLEQDARDDIAQFKVQFGLKTNSEAVRMAFSIATEVMKLKSERNIQDGQSEAAEPIGEVA